jgi:hypothetical protein
MEKIEETIKEIAVKHGIAVGRDDPIMILHTINERLMKETAISQRQILHEFKEELESVAHEWEITAKKTAEKILNAALSTSKEAMAEGGKTAAKALGREIDSRLAQVGASIRSARKLVIINVVAAVVTLLAAVAVLWVITRLALR